MDEGGFDFEAEIDAKDALRKATLRDDGRTPADNAATRGRHSIVCKHWLRNLCMKGDRCDFLHQFDPNKMPECMFWLKYGKCNDPDCVFRHVAPSQRPECQRYRMGFCKYGPMCRSRHDRMRPDDMLEVLPDKFLEDILVNAHLIPKVDEVRIDPNLLRRDRSLNGGLCTDLALMPTPSTEEGTIPGLLPPIHGRCRYFIIRSMNVRNVQISAAKGIWATSVGNTPKLRQAFKDVDHVILVFSATESRSFQGYAKMMSSADDGLLPGIWGEFSCRLGANFRVHWLKQCTPPLSTADHIKTHEELPMRRCRDGQELPSSVGERVCRFLWQQPDVDLLQGSGLEFEPRANYDDTPLPDAEIGSALRADGKGPGAPLALEDKKEVSGMDDGRSRPAPVKLGSFDQGANWKEGLRESKDAKAMASGSSSVLAAINKDRSMMSMSAPHWAPGWRPHYPTPFYPPGPFHHPPGYFPVAGMPGIPSSHFGEAPPPGFWGDRGGAASFAQPPADWQGASSTAANADTRRLEKKRRRSRSEKKVRKKSKR